MTKPDKLTVAEVEKLIDTEQNYPGDDEAVEYFFRFGKQLADVMRENERLRFALSKVEDNLIEADSSGIPVNNESRRIIKEVLQSYKESVESKEWKREVAAASTKTSGDVG